MQMQFRCALGVGHSSQLGISDAISVVIVETVVDRAQQLTYEQEKELGIRKENGARKLKELSIKHKEIIALHLDGWKTSNIADYMNMSIPHISLILNDPLAQDIISAAHEHVDLEFNALYAKVVDVIRDGLDERQSGPAQRMRAVDRYIKLKQVNVEKEKGPDTAEDVIARLLEHPLAQINIINQIGETNGNDNSSSNEPIEGYCQDSLGDHNHNE